MKLDQREPTARRPWGRTDQRTKCGHATATPKRRVERTTVIRRRAMASGHSPRLKAPWPRCPAPGKLLCRGHSSCLSKSAERCARSNDRKLAPLKQATCAKGARDHAMCTDMYSEGRASITQVLGGQYRFLREAQILLRSIARLPRVLRRGLCEHLGQGVRL